METLDAILSRRSVARLTERVPGRETVEKLLEAAVRAPTHHLTQPWRFVVLAGEERDRLGRAWAQGVERAGKDPSGIVAKALRAPLILCVIERPKVHLPKVVEIEEHHATGAALQNILLAAHDMGLGAMLRTGPACAMPEVREMLGVEEDELVAGFVYLGYPQEGAGERPMTRRTAAAELTEWRGS
ncbi:MAG: nitroreductase [Actinomycetota bacterium]|nr:nitroreductase [Actinomycetota bacterium]